ncbi:MAG: EamA family transporter [Candidatus Aminicenantales bacterium]
MKLGSMAEVGFFSLLILLWTAAQVLFKLSLNEISVKKVDLKFFGQALTSLPLLVGLFLSVAAFFFWLIILSRFELSYSNLIVSLTFVSILIASAIFLGEEISLLRWLGAIFIVLGVLLVTRTR